MGTAFLFRCNVDTCNALDLNQGLLIRCDRWTSNVLNA